MTARHVSPPIRALVVAVAAFAAWQFAWVADQAERLETVLPDPWTVSGWLVTWCVLMVFAVGAAICSKDMPTRLTFGALAVVEVAGLGVAQAAVKPPGEQFWATGQAILIVIWCLILLTSPLRSIPKAGDHADR